LKKRKAVFTDGPSTVLPIRGSLGEADPRAGDPAQKNCRVRRVTMRHWITSFYLLNDICELGANPPDSIAAYRQIVPGFKVSARQESRPAL
jgi:hypothetical protein